MCIGPESRFVRVARLIDPEEKLSSAVAEELWRLDTGITRLGAEEIPLDEAALPEPVRNDVVERMEEGKTASIGDGTGKMLVVSRKAGKLILQKVVAYHP